jgi:hypothetical protein
VPDVAAADFIGSADRDGPAGPGFGAEVALFLDHYYYAVAFGLLVWWVRKDCVEREVSRKGMNA